MISRTILTAGLLAAAIASDAGPASAQAQHADMKEAMKKACRGDYERFCKGVMPGGGRILACLRKHSSELASDCAVALPTK